MSTKNNNKNNGITFLGALTILFIGLKLGHIITWSWWWVLAPIWIVLPAIAVLILIVFIFLYLKAMLTGDK